MNATYNIGIDVGGTNLVAGLVDENNVIICRTGRPTDRTMTLERLVGDVTGMIDELLSAAHTDKGDIASVGICVPGTANLTTGELEFANNLPNLQGNLPAAVEQACGIKTFFENDANAAALGEYVAEGEPEGGFVMVTLGTGVGGGVILNGGLLRGINFAAAELGHMTIDMHGPECSCGRRGCFEMYGSAEALKKQAAAAGLTIQEAKQVFDLFREHDRTAEQVVEQYSTYLAEGLANIINIFQPKTLSLGGGVSKASDILLPMVGERMRPLIYSRHAAINTQLKAAVLYNDAGILGAANLYRAVAVNTARRDRRQAVT